MQVKFSMWAGDSNKEFTIDGIMSEWCVYGDMHLCKQFPKNTMKMSEPL